MKNYIFKTYEFYNNTILSIDSFIDSINIRTILITSLVFLFFILFTLKLWDTKIIKNNLTTELHFVSTEVIDSSNQDIDSLETLVMPELNQPIKNNITHITSKELKFIEDISKLAIIEAKKFGIPASIKIAQGALESGWGQDKIAKEINNLYGMKYKSTFNDYEKQLILGRINRNTKEYVKGVITQTKDMFVVYNSRWNSIRHHSVFIKSRIDDNYNEGYSSMKNLSNKNYKDWAKALQKAKYSTNPQYADMLINIIEEYNLHKFDK